ncbi:MAG: D-allose transporter substrate-binding protein [Synergistaceae bacterium]|jgi:D-allose transport system substrate-binding protein|nr:D-allose transporter substrate-binding protein [Synergistaceae bacterium]
MKNMKKMISSICLVLVAVAVLPGMSAAADDIKVAMLLKTLANPFWVDMKDGIEAEGAKLGVKVDVFAVESEADIDGQLKKLEDILSSGSYNGIGVAPITATNLISGVVRANENGIPVVNIDAKIDEKALKEAGGYVIGFATSDNYKVGAIGAEYIMKQLPNGGKIAIIEGRAGDLSGELRRDGCKDTLAKTGGGKYEVVDVQPADWDRQKALDVATNIITRTPDLGAFFVANDTMGLGVLQAISNTGKTGKILLTSTDASDESREAIKEGLMAAVCQDPGQIGATCLDILVEAVKAGNKGAIDKAPAEQLVDANLFTKDNI